MGFATVCIGLLVALLVNIMHTFIELCSSRRIEFVLDVRRNEGLLQAWSIHTGVAALFTAGAFLCVLAVPQSRGSGIPNLLAYLNGCKIPLFTSLRVLVAKVVGTICSLSAGLYCGPEGPIIHVGACCGKLLVRMLCYLGRFITPTNRYTGGLGTTLAALRNDLDQRDFVAVGAGAGVAAAFMAPVSATLVHQCEIERFQEPTFPDAQRTHPIDPTPRMTTPTECVCPFAQFVVEEAASHFSLPLLWRTFLASIIALWGCHLLTQSEIISGHIDPAATPSSAATQNRRDAAHRFHISFDLGSGAACSLSDLMFGWVILLAVLGGWLGVALNHGILSVNSLRARIYAPRPSRRRLACIGAFELATLVLLSSSASILLPELLPCRPLSIGMLEYAYTGAAGQELPTGKRHLDNECMPDDLREQIVWTSEVNGTCDATCLTSTTLDRTTSSIAMLSQGRCNATEYHELGSLLFASGEGAVRALFLRGAPAALGPTALFIALLTWIALVILSAGAPISLGLMIPMIVIGGCAGRLYGYVLHFWLHIAEVEPSILALIGSTAVLAGSGQIRLFFATVMLEITDQLHLAPFVALAAMIATFVADKFSHHGLCTPAGLDPQTSHASHPCGPPYLPLAHPEVAGSRPRSADHALIEQAHLPYLPLERREKHGTSHCEGTPAGAAGGGGPGSEPLLGDVREWWCCRRWSVQGSHTAELLVGDVMAAPLVCVARGQSKAEVLPVIMAERHHGFPVVAPDGTLDGVLLKTELAHFDDTARVDAIADTAPACVAPHWPLERAHRLFLSLGLRHLVVCERNGRPVGIMTRHDFHSPQPRRNFSSLARGQTVEPLPPVPLVPQPEPQQQSSRQELPNPVASIQ